MKKIMFSDAYKLTEAVLSGRKTQTRRIIKRNQLFERQGMWTDDEKKAWEKSGISESDFQSKEDKHNAFEWLKAHASYKVGEIVAVAQSYKDAGYKPDKIWYRYVPQHDGYLKQYAEELKGWTNKMFVCAEAMPHQIRITNVRVERLQDISDDECIKEGVGISATNNRIGYPFSIPFNYYVGEDKEGCRYSTPREAYAALIDRISGKGTWDSNPYVFVYDFELVK